jgi:hypothetical protein
MPPLDVFDLRVEERGRRRARKLFRTTNSGVPEIGPCLGEVGADVRGLVEVHMVMVLGVRFPAGEYVIDRVDGGRIDSPGIDGSGAPVMPNSVPVGPDSGGDPSTATPAPACSVRWSAACSPGPGGAQAGR